MRSRPAAARRPRARPADGRACRRARRGSRLCLARSSRSRFEPLRAKSSGSMAFSSAVSVGKSWKNWKTMPTFRPRQTASCSSLELVDLLAVDRHRARRRTVDAGDHVHDRRLAAPRRADDGDHLAGVDREVDAAKRRVLELPRPVDLHDRLELDQGLAGRTLDGGLEDERCCHLDHLLRAAGWPHVCGPLCRCLDRAPSG